MPLPLFRLALMAGAGYFFYNRYRNRGGPHPEDVLDAGVKETFPGWFGFYWGRTPLFPNRGAISSMKRCICSFTRLCGLLPTLK